MQKKIIISSLLIVTMISLLLLGCSKESSETTNNATKTASNMADKESSAQVIGINGVVIVEQNGQTYKYIKKCEKCGEVSPGTTVAQMISTKNAYLSSVFTCTKCKNHQKIKIQRVQ